jgi:hypothetical protein
MSAAPFLIVGATADGEMTRKEGIAALLRKRTVRYVDFVCPRSTDKQSLGSAGQARPETQLFTFNQTEVLLCDS